MGVARPSLPKADARRHHRHEPLIQDEICTASVESGQLVRVLPRYRGGSGAIYLVWPSRKLVPAPVVAARELLIEELGKMYR